jgi:CheY-like chemotaxis protein
MSTPQVNPPMPPYQQYQNFYPAGVNPYSLDPAQILASLQNTATNSNINEGANKTIFAVSDAQRQLTSELNGVEKNIYDLVLMDMQMPNMDGLEATRILRSHKDWHQPVVIAVTANAFPEDRAACMSAGMDDFFGKPINIEGLTEVLLNHFPIKA